MFCGNCGKELKEGEILCTQCSFFNQTDEQIPTKESSWKLALFSDPTNLETLPTKIFEIIALCFGVAQVGVLLYFTYNIALLWLVAAVFAVIVFPPIGLFFLLVGALILALVGLCFQMSLGFLYRQRKALLGMIVFTALMSMIAYFTVPMNPPGGGFYHIWLSWLMFTFQYLPSIVIGLMTFLWLR